jgi:hypothetical protein
MRLAVATLAVLLLSAAPAGATGALTRTKAERLVERKAEARHGDTAHADCVRRSRRTFTCTWHAPNRRAPTGEDCTFSEGGRATVTRRDGRTSVRLHHPYAVFCDSGR